VLFLKIQYDDLANTYEETREIEPIVYALLCHFLKIEKGNVILEFGCGTGNYLKKLISDYEISPYGLEPSESMRMIAEHKLGGGVVSKGDHEFIPFSDNYFNKLYCIDVVHHVRELDLLFTNIKRVSAPNSLFCICTESHSQLEEKYWLKYFPSIIEIDHSRFHSVDDIIDMGITAGWKHKGTFMADSEHFASISENTMKRFEQKSLSVLHLISSDEYKRGLKNMKLDFDNGTEFCQKEGYTFILFEKGNN